jgi:uncharacterized RDD family membrane protein YckC
MTASTPDAGITQTRSSPGEAARTGMARPARGAHPTRRVRTMVTPEGAALRLTIGTFGERAGAFVIDFIIQWALVLVVVLSIGFSASRFGMQGWAIAGALIAVFVFVFRNFYFVFFEMGRRAATPGKRLIGLRVAARDGGQLQANAVLARNFMREIEVGLPLSFLFMSGDQLNATIGLLGFLWAGVFMLFPLFNKDRLRVGDLVAGTWVIHAPKPALKPDITASASASSPDATALVFTPAQLDTYGIHELQVLEDVLRQSTREAKTEVASRIRSKISWQTGPGETDLAFLEAYYAALRRHLEQRMLFGQKKHDKFDPT